MIQIVHHLSSRIGNVGWFQLGRCYAVRCILPVTSRVSLLLLSIKGSCSLINKSIPCRHPPKNGMCDMLLRVAGMKQLAVGGTVTNTRCLSLLVK